MFEHIKTIEFVERIYHTFEFHKVALFNDTKISEDKAEKLILKGVASHCDDIVVISKRKFDSLCGK